MLTELQTRKLVKYFSMYDADCSGCIVAQNFEQIAKKLADRRNWSLRSPRYLTLINQFKMDWKYLNAAADKSDNSEINLEEWLAYYDAVLNDSGQYQKSLRTLMNLVVEAFDADEDGKICESEWGEFLSIFNVSPVYAPRVFPLIDVDKSGFLDRDSIMNLLDDFFHSDEPTCSANEMFGPY
ncbi:MAG: hypothetical protein WBA57_03700 [Elainellaceae cyanobacterium]